MHSLRCFQHHFVEHCKAVAAHQVVAVVVDEVEESRNDLDWEFHTARLYIDFHNFPGEVVFGAVVRT